MIKDMTSFILYLQSDKDRLSKLWEASIKIADISDWANDDLKNKIYKDKLDEIYLGINLLCNTEVFNSLVVALGITKIDSNTARLNKFKSQIEQLKIDCPNYIQDNNTINNENAYKIIVQVADKVDKLKAASEQEAMKPVAQEVVEDPEDDVEDIEDVDDYTGEYKEPEVEEVKPEEKNVEQSENKNEVVSETKEEKKEESAEQLEAYNRMSKIESTWSSDVNNLVDALLKVYRVLYESCYDVGRPAGILTSKGIIRTKTDGTITDYGDKVTNVKLFMAINKQLVNFGFDKYILKNGQVVKEPDIKDLIKADKSVMLYGTHLQFMFGHRRYCKGLNSYLKDCKSGFNTDRVTSWSTMEGYIRYSLSSYIYKALYDVGLSDEVTEETIGIERNVLENLNDNLKNVIVVCDSTPGQNTELRICSGSQIQDVNGFLRNLQAELNTGNTINTKVKQIGKYENGILDVNIIYNERRYMDASLYAHEVLDSLLNQGIQPSWSKVIMGKGLDGKTYYHNFRDDKAPVICLYASSRSGKGVMTLNLLASALADGCKVMYTDGKPDTANILAQIAWRAGKEAAIVNGTPADTGDLECLPGSPRKSFAYRGINEISRLIFPDETQLKQFYRLVQYYRSLELTAELAEKRKLDNSKTPADWLVCVFDEIQNLAKVEIQLTERMKSISVELNKQVADESKGKNSSPDINKVAAIKFIKDYNDWVTDIITKWTNGKTISFGKANITILFIWQTSEFPFNDQKSNDRSGLSRLVKMFSTATKMLGRKAMNPGGLTAFGNTQTEKALTWYDEKFTGPTGGFFGITESLSEDNAKVIRPYNLYGDANGKTQILQAAAKNGFSPEDLIGSSLYRDSNGEYQVIPEVGFEGYAKKLLGQFGLDTATQIDVAYEYVDSFVKEATGGQAGYLDYMYSSRIGLGSYKDKAGIEEVNESGDSLTVSGDIDLLNSDGTVEEEPVVENVDMFNSSDTGETPSDNGYKAQFYDQDTQSNNSGATFISDDEPVIKNELNEALKSTEKAQKRFDDPDLLEIKRKENEEYLRKMQEMLADLNRMSEPIESNSEDKDEKAYKDYQELAHKQQIALMTEKTIDELKVVNKLRNIKEPLYNVKRGKPIYLDTKEIKNYASKVTPENTISTNKFLNSMSLSRIVNKFKGTNNEISAIFNEIMLAIERNGVVLGKITKLTLVDGEMYLNNRHVETASYINEDDSNLTICEVADFNIIRRKLHNLRELTIDSVAYESLEITSKFKSTDDKIFAEYLFDRFHDLCNVKYITQTGKVLTFNKASITNNQVNEITALDDTCNRLNVASAGRAVKNNVSSANKIRISKTLGKALNRHPEILNSAGAQRAKKVAGIAGKAGVLWAVGAALSVPLLPIAACGYAWYTVKTLVNNGKNSAK